MEIVVRIANKRGLHARAAAKFVKVVAGYNVPVHVTKLGGENAPPVGGASILGLMMLGADQGSSLKISAEGAEAPVVLNALKELIENRFGEDE